MEGDNTIFFSALTHLQEQVFVEQRVKEFYIDCERRVLVSAVTELSSGAVTSGYARLNMQTKFVDCVVGVIYEIPLSCSRVYIGK